MTFSVHRLQRLTILNFGVFDVGPGKRTIGIPGYLLETDLGARILVDTGFDALYAANPAKAEARDGLSAFGKLINHTAARTLEGQLSMLGLGLSDISALVLTHSHIDHVGGLPLLSCPVYLTAAERAAPRPLYFGTARPIPWPDLPYQLITGDTALAQGIRLIPTPGHTPGHLSLALTLHDGQALVLAADAINRAGEPAEGFPDAMDPAAAAVSAQRLFDIARDTGARLVYGHDPDQWPLLPKAPQQWP